MPIKPPVTELIIKTASSGFYSGFAKDVTITTKILVGALVVWAIGFPEHSGALLGKVNGFLLANFNYWYIYVMAFYVLVCLSLAIVPSTGRLKLGRENESPEFSTFSWFSMLFGAGLGIGLLTYAAGEPLYHLQTNPDVIQGHVAGNSWETVPSAMKWTFFHWGLSAWACYSLCGLALAFFAYRRGLPLTIRSALASLFGKKLSGTTGAVIDIIAVVATVLGVAQTIGYGVEQLVAGLYRIGFGEWLIVIGENGKQTSSTAGIVLSLMIIIGASTLSAMSGVGRGIKWLSNLNMILSLFLLGFFLFFGATFFGFQTLLGGVVEYVVSLPAQLFNVWVDEGTETSQALSGWQNGWTVFYWAWWIAFAPFVGVFLARISKGRTIREFILGAMLASSGVCFIWFSAIGGTAIDLELSGAAQGAIANTALSDQLYATIAVMLEPAMAWVFSIIVVVLLLTYQITSADSAVLVINTINAAGDEGPKARPHILFWGTALAVVTGGLLILGGLDAIKTAMVIGALPFSAVLVLMGISVVSAIIRDAQRERLGLPVSVPAE